MGKRKRGREIEKYEEEGNRKKEARSDNGIEEIDGTVHLVWEMHNN